MSANAEIRIAAAKMAKRLKTFQRLAQQARERGDSTVELHINELWEPSDQEAMDAYESVVHEINGARPLPFGEVNA